MSWSSKGGGSGKSAGSGLFGEPVQTESFRSSSGASAASGGSRGASLLGPETRRVVESSSRRLASTRQSSGEMVLMNDVPPPPPPPAEAPPPVPSEPVPVLPVPTTAHTSQTAETRALERPSIWRRLIGNCAEPEEVVGKNISSPTNFQHHIQVKFDETTQKFQGLPADWAKEINKQFGVPLVSVQSTHVPGYESRIPSVLVHMYGELVRLGGMQHEGVFRVSADKNDVDSYRQMFDDGNFRECGPQDAMVMAALIKAWFRSLPSSLLAPLANQDGKSICSLVVIIFFPFLMLTITGRSVSSRLVIAASKAPDVATAQSIMLTQLPEPNKSVFLWLLDVLAEAASFQPVNRMGPKALAVVLAPNLYNTSDELPPQEMFAFIDASVNALQMCLEQVIASKKVSSDQVVNGLEKEPVPITFPN